MDDPECLCVLGTGRHKGMKLKGEHICKIILDSYGLKFDKYFYNPSYKPTLEYKIDTIKQLLKQYRNIDYVQIWEDRHAHVSKFRDLLKYYRKIGKIADGKVCQV